MLEVVVLFFDVNDRNNHFYHLVDDIPVWGKMLEKSPVVSVLGVSQRTEDLCLAWGSAYLRAGGCWRKEADDHTPALLQKALAM